jgi:glycosyltransferase involved in cell wall biosynthesis
MTELVTLRHAAVRSLMTNVDLVVALCGWAREVLVRNGVPTSKILVSPHGLPDLSADEYMEDSAGVPPSAAPIRLAYLGRLHPTKGVDVLIRGLRSLPFDAPLELDIYGVAQSGNTGYERQLKALAGGDPRISFRPPVPNGQVVNLLRRYHALVVPSQWLETGPLVVLEAFAAGTPVIGSRLGGIAEKVSDGVDGLLVEPGVAGAWYLALKRIVEQENLLVDLRRGVRPPRRMADVAREMLTAYRRVLAQSSASPSVLAGTAELC